MNRDELLRESFRSVGKEFGYETVNAEYVAFKDFKVKWRATGSI